MYGHCTNIDPSFKNSSRKGASSKLLRSRCVCVCCVYRRLFMFTAEKNGNGGQLTPASSGRV